MVGVGHHRDAGAVEGVDDPVLAGGAYDRARSRFGSSSNSDATAPAERPVASGVADPSSLSVMNGERMGCVDAAMGCRSQRPHVSTGDQLCLRLTDCVYAADVLARTTRASVCNQNGHFL